MLLEFRVSNFRSIAEEQIVSLLPAKAMKEYPENVLRQGKHEALNVLGFYGANASGKSNVMLALYRMNTMVSKATKLAAGEALEYEPFALKEGFEAEPTRFQVTMVINEIRYRYGFAYNQTQIVEEWLYKQTSSKETELFVRYWEGGQQQIVTSRSLKASKAVVDETAPNVLFLSLSAARNVQDSRAVVGWFRKFSVTTGIGASGTQLFTAKMLVDGHYKDQIISLIKKADVSIQGFEIKELNVLDEMDTSDMPDEMKDFYADKKTLKTSTLHVKYDTDGFPLDQTVHFQLGKHESTGTQLLFSYAGPILQMLLNGGVLASDEIDGHLHSSLTLSLIELFLDPATNPKGAQLLFTTHDTNLLRYANLRRDQIYFTEKNRWEATEIFALSDFKDTDGKKERNDTDRETRYLQGRYGAVPNLASLHHVVEQLHHGKEA